MDRIPLQFEQFEIMNGHGESIRGDVRYSRDGIKKPVVIICHSFMAFKNWGFFPYLAESIARAGYVSIIFNFSFNGVSGDAVRITEFDKFAKNTFTRELEDLTTIIDAVCNGGVAGRVCDPSRLALLGHSRGGGIAIIQTAVDHRVSVLTSLSAISTFDRWREHQKSVWRTNGTLPLARDCSISPLRLGLGLLDDIERHADALNILNAAAKISVPWLIVHGSADVTVNRKEADELYQAANPSVTKLHIVEHVGHLYNAASPDEDQYRTLNTIIETTVQFFNRTL